VVFASVAKTGRCLIVHEAVEAFGPGAEIAARIADGVLWELDGPVARLGARPAPVPYSPSLEAHMLPTHRSIAAKAREVAAA
jgi:pyruvate/2-oxoglutarate/acetoin dehydrogenase E1 component